MAPGFRAVSNVKNQGPELIQNLTLNKYVTSFTMSVFPVPKVDITNIALFITQAQLAFQPELESV